MGVVRLDHVGMVVDDIEAAVAFFEVIGLKRQPTEVMEGAWLDQIVGMKGVRTDLVVLTGPGETWFELSKFHHPAEADPGATPPDNRIGLRHVAFAVDDVNDTVERLGEAGYERIGDVVDYEDRYRLVYVRGPEGIIVELDQEL